ncbi:MAG: LysM peptidoglycan-binding domain-containing protein [Pseudomonadales bacterium]|nr:LysM peptidoglycan-binding domain-containing protein [Pseudomonadales bacterium]
MSFTPQSSVIFVCLAISLSSCQPLTKTSADQSLITKPQINPDQSADNLIKLVSEEIVIAASLPINSDGQDDIVEREDDPSPLAPEITQQTQDLWQRMRQGFSLDHHLDDTRVKSELNWYIRHPDYLDRVATRATRYLYHIVEQVEKRQLPLELALLPIVESAFDPFAYSNSRASGLWQFIPSTGKLYGLKIDYWYDGRRDVTASTNAALNYLAASHRSLNDDWLLALAAYNTGEGNVRYSMRKNRKAGKPVDFFSLKLFRETRAYVPRLLAISEIIAHPEKYNITLKAISNKAYFEVVDITTQLDLTKAAELAEISVEELYLLNPAFNKWTTHPDGPHQLLIPIGRVERFRHNMAQLPVDQRLGWQQHKIRNGESLGVIAERYHTTIDTLRSANDIKGNLIVAGKYLLIPMAIGQADQYQLSDSQRLLSRQAILEKKIGTSPLQHTVKAGDNFWDLSRQYKVSMRNLAKWNGMATTDLLMPGQQLKIFNKQAKLAIASPMTSQVIRKVNYKVRRGESLARIANKFNLPVRKIQQWNTKISRQKYLQPGDKITLYIDITKTE